MRTMRLTDYWKDANEYVRSLILITRRYGIDDIKSCGKEVVLFGWVPGAALVLSALKNAGINVKYVCEVHQIPSAEFPDGMPVSVGGGDLLLKDYRELLKESEKYFFLFYSTENNFDIWISGLIKRVRLLQYQGVEEFGLIYDVVTRDVFGDERIRQCIYDSINEIFKGISLYNWSAIWLCYTQAGIDIQNYDYLLHQLYKAYKDQPKKTMLEIGPGVGVLSLTLKKLLDIDISWLTLSDDEQQWSLWRSSDIRKLYNKYDIHIKEANVETDEFDGYYDIIFMSQVLEHFIFNPVPTIKKLMAHLSDDGRMFLAFPNLIYNDPPNVESYREMPYYKDLSVKEAVRRSVINSLTHFHEYTFGEAMELFDECGLECIAHHTNPPIMHFILKKK